MASNSCFTRQFRLLHSREFQFVFNNTKCKSSDRFLVVLAAPNEYDHARLGLALSKKRIKTAVSRNRLKRLIRDSFRHHNDDLPNLDIVVIGHSRAAEASNKEIFNSLEIHWNKLAARCKNS